jgi:hypothetical protein
VVSSQVTHFFSGSSISSFAAQHLKWIHLCIDDGLCLFFGCFTLVNIWKADLLARYGGVAPKMAEEAHALAIDQV